MKGTTFSPEDFLMEDKYSQYLPLIDEKARSKLRLYFKMLLDKALPYGYIGKADKETLWLRHILDSLLVLNTSILFSGSIVDLGTGAGIPGIPLAIMLRDISFSLIDSSRKKIDFLREVKSALKLNNITLAAKNVGKMNVKKDMVIFRAFQKPLVSLELSLYHVKKGGRIYYWRSRLFTETGNEAFDEKIKKRMKKFGLKIIEHKIFKVPRELGSRGIVLIEHFTDPESPYPRSMEEIKNDPLNKKLSRL